MLDNKDSVQLSEYLFNICEVLKTAIQGRSAEDLNESVKKALEGLERCVEHIGIVCFPTNRL